MNEIDGEKTLIGIIHLSHQMPSTFVL